MNKQQQMQDILKDTVDYYSKDPANRRSVTDDGDCMYTWGKKHCAVGRYLRKEYQDETWSDNNMSAWELSEYSGNMTIDQFLVDKVHGLDLDFWRDLQDMHDTVGYWEEWHEHKDGVRDYKLTDLGKEAYVRFQDKITEGQYDV
jgi:hypothetical protein